MAIWWKLQGRHIGSMAIGSILLLLLCPFENRMSWNLRIIVFWVANFLPNIIKMLVVNIDWLYWCLLFVPFYAFYICVGEKLFMLKSHVNILQNDVSGKTKFIEWQNMALSQMDLRIVDLSKEVDLLRKSNENFRKEEESWKKSKELMKRKIREQQKLMSRDAPIVREQVFNTVRQEILTLVKKNKSESIIKNKKSLEEDVPSTISLPKSTRSCNKSFSSLKMDSKKGTSQEWERARMRLMERSKKIMKNRNGGNEKAEEQQYPKIGPDPKTGQGEVACLSTANESETDDSNISLSQGVGPKSASNLEVNNEVCISPPVHSSRSSDPLNKRFSAPGVPGYEISQFGESKVKSYTEVFKRKVHVPTGGSGPRITIEGQRRWCF